MRLLEHYRCEECGVDIEAPVRSEVQHALAQTLCCGRCGSEIKTQCHPAYDRSSLPLRSALR